MEMGFILGRKGMKCKNSAYLFDKDGYVHSQLEYPAQDSTCKVDLKKQLFC